MDQRDWRDAGGEAWLTVRLDDGTAASWDRGLVAIKPDERVPQHGAHIVAAEAGEMSMEPTLAVRFGLTIDDLTSTLHPYLTLSEGIKLTALTFEKDVATLSCCAV